MAWNKPLCTKCGKPIQSPTDSLLLPVAFMPLYSHLDCYERLTPHQRPLSRPNRLLQALGLRPAPSQRPARPSRLSPAPSRRTQLQDLANQDCSNLVLAGAMLEVSFIITLFALLTTSLPLLVWLVFLCLGLVPLWMLAAPCIFMVRLGRHERLVSQLSSQKPIERES